MLLPVSGQLMVPLNGDAEQRHNNILRQDCIVQQVEYGWCQVQVSLVVKQY